MAPPITSFYLFHVFRVNQNERTCVPGFVESHTPRVLTFSFGYLKFLSRQILRSDLAFEPIHKASVLLKLSLRPDALPDVSDKLRNSFN